MDLQRITIIMLEFLLIKSQMHKENLSEIVSTVANVVKYFKTLGKMAENKDLKEHLLRISCLQLSHQIRVQWLKVRLSIHLHFAIVSAFALVFSIMMTGNSTFLNFQHSKMEISKFYSENKSKCFTIKSQTLRKMATISLRLTNSPRKMDTYTHLAGFVEMPKIYIRK